MRIGFLSPHWPNEKYPNGIVKYVEIITKALTRQCHECYVFAGNVEGNKSDQPNVIDVSKSRQKFKSSVLSKIIRKISPFTKHSYFAVNRRGIINNIVYCIKELDAKHSDSFDVIEMEETWGWAKDVYDGVGIPLVIKLHGPWFLCGEALGLKKDDGFYNRVRLEGEGIASVSGVIAPSKCVLEEVRKYYGIELPNAKVIHNPIIKIADESKWKYDNCIKNQILFIGRFDELKGGDVVIDAFNSVASKNKEAKLVFAGPDIGVKYNGSLLSIDDYIDITISDPEIKQRIEYLGKVSPDRTDQLRSKSHVVIIASRWENFANTVLESMAMGCPTIATESGGTPEIITHNETGMLVKPGDAHDMAAKILLVLSDDLLTRKLSLCSSADVEKRFDPDKLAKETSNYYEKIIKGKKNTCRVK